MHIIQIFISMSTFIYNFFTFALLGGRFPETLLPVSLVRSGNHGQSWTRKSGSDLLWFALVFLLEINLAHMIFVFSLSPNSSQQVAR